ncbi:DUF222 domain-containing protein [Salinibacterium sp. G-O1]|uniref:HNH endonuclease signature motif containing protein n=1 Tax=Salinibacterium sp. G-O1 TaxID=3046208 RepID=UPI0024BA1816|nr:HNH endonuclease signature motif containing protein [Salinibacterium sp. G-O1]MDJ0334777.1 DUF222 domain-containing protein [Salinibacterium sp. G-O1]
MTEAAQVLDRVSSLLAAVALDGMVAFDDSALLEITREIEQVGRLTDALRALAAAEVDERSRYELGQAGLAQRLGETRGMHLIEKLTLVSQREASRRVKLGRAIRARACLDGQVLPADYPLVSAAVISGRLGVDAASAIIHALDQAAQRHATLERLEVAEATLAEDGLTLPADLLAVRARVWREVLDPDGAEPRDEVLRTRRAFWIGREENGLTRFGGHADPTNAALLKAALAERAGPNVIPRFLDAQDAPADAESLTGAARDPRTLEQKQFDVVMGLLTAGLRSSEGEPGSMRSVTTVVAVIKLSDLENGTGVGWLDDVDEPVSSATVRELACDGGVKVLTVGSNGEVLNLGRTQRLFSRHQRLALAAVDGGCVWNGCHAPPSWCHAHHVKEFGQGGLTDVDNGVLLCPEHHHLLHASGYQMKMINGRPWLLAPVWLDPDQTWQRVGKSRVLMVA